MLTFFNAWLCPLDTWGAKTLICHLSVFALFVHLYLISKVGNQLRSERWTFRYIPRFPLTTYHYTSSTSMFLIPNSMVAVVKNYLTASMQFCDKHTTCYVSSLMDSSILWCSYDTHRCHSRVTQVRRPTCELDLKECFGERLPVEGVMPPRGWVGLRVSLRGTESAVSPNRAGRTATAPGKETAVFFLLEGGMREAGNVVGTGSFSMARYTRCMT